MLGNVQNWSYPFTGVDANPLANLISLAKANSGYYPMGANGLWHGGVHFDEGTDTTFDQSSVRCIADGEVIAYRIDEQYSLSEYLGDIPLIKRAPFSTGFVLVRHRLALPPLGKTFTPTAPALIFYSLYMHLQDWAGYQHQTTLPRPEFWGDGIYRVETQGSDLNVRVGANQKSTILAALSNGARVKIGAGNGEFRKLLSIVSGTAVPALEHASGEETLPGYLANKFLKAQCEPQAKDKVVVLDTPIPIKAGDLIGHLGRYQNQSEGMPQPLLHLEVFSCEDVPAFIASSRAHAARLPDEQKTLLKIHKGASKLIPHRAAIDANNPPGISDEGVTIGVDLILPQSLLDSLPVDAKLVAPSSTTGGSCSPETRWWRLDNLLADQDGKPISGWLAEQEMITTRHSPWEWEGYDLIEDGEGLAGALAYQLCALQRLRDDERASYQSKIDFSDKGPIKQRLRAILNGNGDRKITPTEIRTALGKPWCAQSIAQLVTRHESEWLWNPRKWDELDELMDHGPAAPNPDWVEEKKRIEKLSWWSELAGKHGIRADSVTWHFHPIGLLATHAIKQKPTIKEGRITFDAEGNDISSSPYFSRTIHWPGNELSGATLGRGYDMGSRSESEIYNHMIAAGINMTQASKISQAHHLKGHHAQQFVIANKKKIGEISFEQQISLFNLIYPFYVRRAITNYDNWTSDETGRTEWTSLHQEIKDILVDFVYQGFTKGPNPMKAGMNNDVHELIRYIENTPAISQYENGRHRADYLRRAAKDRQ